MAHDLFTTEKVKYSDAVKFIEQYEVCGVRTAKNRIKQMTDAGFLERTKQDTSVYYSLKTTEENEKNPF